MGPNLDKLLLHSAYNTFKNLSVQRDELDLPTSMSAGQYYTDTVTFQLTEAIAFLQAYSFATDYGDYFSFLDSQYHNQWRTINNNNDYMILSSSGLLFFNIYMFLDTTNLRVTFTLVLSRVGFGAVTINHPTYKVPITFVDYRLTN